MLRRIGGRRLGCVGRRIRGRDGRRRARVKVRECILFEFREIPRSDTLTCEPRPPRPPGRLARFRLCCRRFCFAGWSHRHRSVTPSQPLDLRFDIFNHIARYLLARKPSAMEHVIPQREAHPRLVPPLARFDQVERFPLPKNEIELISSCKRGRAREAIRL